MNKKYIDLKGRKFGRLTVIEKAKTRISNKGSYIPYWYCICDCQLQLPENERAIISVQGRKLREGITTSCGCMRRISNKKSNSYEIIGNVVKMYSSNDKYFLIDLDDLERVKEFCWQVSKSGYVRSMKPMINGKRQYLALHRFIMDCSNPSLFVDHINHNTFDNRKCNLRIVTPTQNQYNVKPCAYNKSGVRGVRFDKYNNKWVAEMSINKKNRILGYYDNISDAIEKRKEYEKLYYGEFRYDEQLCKELCYE